MSKICTILAKASSSYLKGLSAFIDTLPDGTKIKPWADLVAWPITLFAGVIGLMTAGAGLYEIYTRTIGRLDDEKNIRNSGANVLVSISIDDQKIIRKMIDGFPFVIVPIHLRVENKSPNSYYVPLRSSRWVVNGISLTRNSEIRNFTEGKWNAEVGTKQRDTIASGYSFLDYTLPPAEIMTRDLLIFVPDRRYTYLEAGISFPIISSTSRNRLLKRDQHVKITYSMDEKITNKPPQETLLEYDVLVCGNDTLVMGQTVEGSCKSYKKLAEKDFAPIRSLGFLMRISSTESSI
jgi:hypothetical protein